MNIHVSQALSALVYFKGAPNFLSDSSDLQDSVVFNVNTWLRDTRKVWRPLDSDSDAFSLSAALGLELRFREGAILVTRWDAQSRLDHVLAKVQEDERKSSMRQSLVLAAAEVYLREMQATQEVRQKLGSW